jgi:predicted enzyme related to lactoylglutathione lyase
MLKRLDRLEVATSDLADAASIYEKNFGFTVTRAADGRSASVRVGGAEIRLASSEAVSATLAQTGEGMIALWLEADDLDQVAAAMRTAGLAVDAVRVDHETGRRILTVDPKLANNVPLFIFDRRI